MYKPSHHNIVFKDQEKILIFNAKSKKYIKAISTKNEVLDILNGKSDCRNISLIKKLTDAGVLVKKNFDELGDFELNKNDYINNPRLRLCILPTEKCNFRCVYCYEKFTYGAMSLETQNALISWLRKNIRNYSGLEISWFGGEPLLEKELIYSLSKDMINICKVAKKPFAASITTNGSLLDVDTFKKLLRCHITSFQVTIDGTEESHDKLKIMANGVGTYKNIIQNLVDIKNKVHSSIFRIAIRTNITSDVVNYLQNHLEKLNTIFYDDCRFTFYFRPVGCWGDSKDISVKNELLDNFESIYLPLIKSDITLDYSIYKSMLEDQICFAAQRNQYVVRPDGRIAKCTMLLERDENTIGHLLGDGTMQIDFIKQKNWLISSKPLDNKCKECNMVLTCMERSCPAKDYLLKNTNMCGYESQSYGYILQLLDKNNIFEVID